MKKCIILSLKVLIFVYNKKAKSPQNNTEGSIKKIKSGNLGHLVHKHPQPPTQRSDIR